ncbi:MAG: 4Fe-4S cluster-binding domain-containing protein, partial [Bacillota bacterium]|nr:4Fe-4S cluster-binding domain-containing protein [Bacillota bacterium]
MEEKVCVKLSGIAFESLVNGPGIRRVLFSQGCRHNCEGCFNPDTHSFEGGEEFSADYLVEDILKNPMLKGVTFSGGDPLEQADKFAYIAGKLKKHGLSIWSYT